MIFTSLKSSLVYGITYNFRLSLRFSTHMINTTGAKVRFSCINYFKSIVVLVLYLSSLMH